MNEEVDVVCQSMHVDGSDDEVDVSLARGTFPKRSDDTDVVHHDDHSLTSEEVCPSNDGRDDGQSLKRNDLSTPRLKTCDDVLRCMTKEPRVWR